MSRSSWGNKVEEKYMAKKRQHKSNRKAASFPNAKVPVVNKEIKTRRRRQILDLFTTPTTPIRNRWQKARSPGLHSKKQLVCPEFFTPSAGLRGLVKEGEAWVIDPKTRQMIDKVN